MTLHPIVAALGGDLYQGGRRANVPAFGHSAADRSVSLLLSEGRVIIHGFGAADWKRVRDGLRDRGFIDAEGRLTGEGRGGPCAPRPDVRVRVATARRLWEGGVPVGAADAAGLYLRRRAIRGLGAHNLRFHPSARLSVYRGGGPTRPALMARISGPDGCLTGVELTYLEPNGLPATGVRLARKTVGVVPPGAAVRLSPSGPRLLVAEGVATTLSAIDRFGLPGWALMSANNLAAWRPPPDLRALLIAADRGAAGEAAAVCLGRRLRGLGVRVGVRRPAAPFGDWNEAAMKREEEGR